METIAFDPMVLGFCLQDDDEISKIDHNILSLSDKYHSNSSPRH